MGPLLTAQYAGGRSVPLDRVVLDYVDEDPLLTVRFEAELIHRDRGGIDVDLTLRMPPAARLVRLSVYDGTRWSDAAPVVRDESTRPPRDPDDLEPAYVATATTEKVQMALRRIPEGSTVKVRGEFLVLRADAPETWSNAEICWPPARAMSVRRWDHESYAESRAEGPPRPVWSWEGDNVSAPPPLWNDDVRGELGVADSRLAMVRFRPVGHDHAEEPRSLAILVDTSASRAGSFESTVEHLHQLLARLKEERGPELACWIVAFDQTAKTVFRGPIGGY
ncbi:MAG: hypothetical protein ACPHRO_12710, partial [Nannocystaceae bacterium]